MNTSVLKLLSRAARGASNFSVQERNLDVELVEREDALHVD